MNSNQEREGKREKKVKPHFRPAPDDTKPFLQDPILRADPIETEEAVIRLPTFLGLITESNSTEEVRIPTFRGLITKSTSDARK